LGRDRHHKVGRLFKLLHVAHSICTGRLCNAANRYPIALSQVRNASSSLQSMHPLRIAESSERRRERAQKTANPALRNCNIKTEVERVRDQFITNWAAKRARPLDAPFKNQPGEEIRPARSPARQAPSDLFR
jgi:hypothetical protein